MTASLAALASRRLKREPLDVSFSTKADKFRRMMKREVSANQIGYDVSVSAPNARIVAEQMMKQGPMDA